ncbi:MAG: prepilin-type N-terminal cleavage/methylation domain-containing protein [Candidatus Taylorbacteria bacterium]|nr:prepilin-type N-terminal cleavage/methylation domain-containing protein [Candidatus Taylorbacteria bacterium]
MRNKGFTLIELLVVISIIALLSSVALSSLNAARAKGRYATIIRQMKEIQTASHGYYTDTGSHAADTGPGGAPAFVPAYLRSWPTPPCGAGWTYDWDNWTSSNGFVGVHLHNTTLGAQYKLCTDTTSACSASSVQDILTVAQRSITCQ